MYDVIILTQQEYLNPSDIDAYVQNILTEESLLLQALEKRGLKVARKAWSDADFDWKSTKCAVFRNTWDYFDRFGEFQKWLDDVETKTRLINPIEQIRWNMDKHYLQDLANKGIDVVETKYIRKGEKGSLSSIIEETGWKDLILKPTVAGAARHTYKLNAENVGEHETIFAELIANEDMMLQPFQYNIATKGEVSFMTIGGKYTHAILKKAKAGDFRVQDDFGGTVHNYKASEEEKAFAEKVTRACDPLPSYARIDVMWDNQGRQVVSEVELIEPELWFRENPDAADLLADEVVNFIED